MDFLFYLLPIKEYLKKYYEILIYFSLSILLTLSLFIKEFSIITTLFAIILSIILKPEQIIGIFVFTYPFDFLLRYPFDAMMFLFRFILSVILLIKLLMDTLNKRHKPSFKIFILMLTFIAYTIIPIPESKPFSLILCTYMFLSYATYEYREKINLSKLVTIFACAMIISGLFHFFRGYSELLEKSGVWGAFEYIRLQGCFEHPNIYAFHILVTIGALSILLIENKISINVFIPLHLICFILGYLTISRLFIICFIISTIIFYLTLIKQYRFESLNYIIPITALLLIIALLFFDITNCYISRMTSASEIDNFIFNNQNKLPIENININQVWNGEIYYDYGRIAIWKVYIEYLLIHPLALIFGRGPGIALGKRHAHNFLLYTLYLYGFIGIVLYLIFVYFAIGGKNTLKNKNILNLFILLIPIFIFQLFEYISDFAIFYFLFGFYYKNRNTKNNNDYENMKYMLNQYKIKNYSIKLGAYK